MDVSGQDHRHLQAITGPFGRGTTRSLRDVLTIDYGYRLTK